MANFEHQQHDQRHHDERKEQQRIGEQRDHHAQPRRDKDHAAHHVGGGHGRGILDRIGVALGAIDRRAIGRGLHGNDAVCVERTLQRVVGRMEGDDVAHLIGLAAIGIDDDKGVHGNRRLHRAGQRAHKAIAHDGGDLAGGREHRAQQHHKGDEDHHGRQHVDHTEHVLHHLSASFAEMLSSVASAAPAASFAEGSGSPAAPASPSAPTPGSSASPRRRASR